MPSLLTTSRCHSLGLILSSSTKIPEWKANLLIPVPTGMLSFKKFSQQPTISCRRPACYQDDMTETCTDEDRCQVRKGCSNRRNWPVQDSFYCRSTSPRKHRTHLHPTRRPAVRCPSTSTQSPGTARGAAWPASLQGRRSSNTPRYHSRQRTRPLVSQPQSLRWLCLGTTYHTVNSSPSNNHSERDHRKVCRTSYSISMTFRDLGLIPKLSRPGKWDF